MSFESLSKFLAPIRDGSVNTELIYRETMMRSSGSAVVGSAWWCIDVFSPPLLFRSPLDKRLVHLNTGCPLTANYSITSSATLSHEPSGCQASVAYHFSSDPCPKNDQCPLVKIFGVRQHLKIYVYNFFIVFFVSNDVVVPPHEYDAMLEIFRHNFEFNPSCFGLHGGDSGLCALGQRSTRTRLVLRQSCPAHDKK